MSNLNTEYPAFVAALFNRTGDLSKDFSHAVMGIVTEIHELHSATDPVNALEEAGDLEFFFEALQLVVKEFLGGAIDEAIAKEALENIEAMLGSGAPVNWVLETLRMDLLDVAKRWVGYGKEPVDIYGALAKAEIAAGIALTVGQLEHGAEIGDQTERRLSNMRKLLQRYKGGKFDALSAIVRDLEAERAAVAGVGDEARD